MNIVVEGPDNSGKSTLVDYLANAFGMPVIRGSKPGTPEELQARAADYLRMDNVIIDRHPCISEPIYGPACRGQMLLAPYMIRRFYETKPVLIYCKNTRGLDGHVVKPGSADSSSHLALLEVRHQAICLAYDHWGLHCARIMYRIGDDKAAVAHAAYGIIRHV